jgi:hypothetical protein
MRGNLSRGKKQITDPSERAPVSSQNYPLAREVSSVPDATVLRISSD